MIEELESKLEFLLDNKIRTCLIEGEKGIGKTLIIKKLFDKKFGKGKWRYYSGSTMDPVIDLIGCPVKVTENDINFMELIQQKDFALDQVSAIFCDEYNRGEKLTRNALMELIQFGKMNGREFKNLKHIWAAVNPDDGTYQVEEIDPSQEDKFEVHLKLPYEISTKFFKEKYGKSGEIAVKWWRNLPEDIRKLVSPRRVDYALDYHNKGGSLKDILNEKSNPIKLEEELNNINYIDMLNNLKTDEEIKEFLNNPNNLFNVKQHILDSKLDYIKYLPTENLTALISSDDKVYNYCLNNIEQFKDIIDEILKANLDKNLINKVKCDSRYQNPELNKEIRELENKIINISDLQECRQVIQNNLEKIYGNETIVLHLIALMGPNANHNEDQLVFDIMNGGLNV